MKKGALEAFILHVIGVGALFLTHTTLARFMGSRAYGTFNFATALGAVFAVIVPLGWPPALMRFIAEYQEQQTWGLFKGVIQRSYQITLASSMFFTAVLFGASYWSGISPEIAIGLRYAALLLPVLSFVALRRRALQALQSVKASIAFDEIVLPALVLAGFFVFSARTASKALLVYWMSGLVVLLLASCYFWKSLPVQGRHVKPEFQTRLWMSVALPLMFGGITQVAIDRSGIVMLGGLADMHSAGIYSAAARLANLNVFILVAVNTIAGPLLASEFHGNRFRHFSLVMRKAMLWSALGSLPLFLVMLNWPGLLLGFFGPDFAEGEGPGLLRVLALGSFVNAATGPVGLSLMLTGQELLFSASAITIAILTVVGNFMIIPLFGCRGAAWVAASSVAIFNVWLLGIYMYRERRLLHVAVQSE